MRDALENQAEKVADLARTKFNVLAVLLAPVLVVGCLVLKDLLH